MTEFVRRAGGFAAVGTLALAAPALGRFAPLVFLAVALPAAFVVSEGPLFELFARPGDHEAGALHGLAGFSLAVAGLAFLGTEPVFRMPVGVFVGTVLLVAYGNLGEAVARSRRDAPGWRTVGFGVTGVAAGTAGMVVGGAVGLLATWPVPTVVFLAAAGTLLAALLRSVLFVRDDPLVLLSVGLLLWFLQALAPPPGTVALATALAVTVGFGIAAYLLGTASIPGMLTGVFLGLLTLVLGGPRWFGPLIAFFAIGGLATKFRYETKLERGVAEDNEGARGSGNVLGNSAIAFLALLGFTAAPVAEGVPPLAFVFAFAGAVATAMSDTLSSEIGGVYDRPRLITTMEVVEPGTDGGVTWQGVVAGSAGALLVAVLAFGLFGAVEPLGAVAVLVAGVAGMNVDSLLGATLEGRVLGNQGVNFLATLAGAVLAAAGAALLGCL